MKDIVVCFLIVFGIWLIVGLVCHIFSGKPTEIFSIVMAVELMHHELEHHKERTKK